MTKCSSTSVSKMDALCQDMVWLGDLVAFQLMACGRKKANCYTIGRGRVDMARLRMIIMADSTYGIGEIACQLSLMDQPKNAVSLKMY